MPVERSTTRLSGHGRFRNRHTGFFYIAVIRHVFMTEKRAHLKIPYRQIMCRFIFQSIKLPPYLAE